jgi:hypothetical protein
LRLCDDRERESVDHQPEQHEIEKEAANLLGAQPENIGDLAHRRRLSAHRQRRREGLRSFSIEMSKADIEDAIARGILKPNYDAWDVLVS